MKNALLAIACGMAFNALAQENSDSAYVLNEVVVTASRTPMAMSDLMSDVTVIRGEEIRMAGAKSLTELLRNQPGIEVASQGGLGSQSGLFIRGTNANHTLVLVDGMRINSATVGLTALEHIPLSQIERIEILRGPASSLYGADAIGGVVQIFTRDGMGGAGPRLEAGVGSFGTVNLSGGYTHTSDRMRASIYLGQMLSDGFDATTPSINPDDDGYRNRNASVRLETALSADHGLGMNAITAKTRTQYDGSPGMDDVQKQALSSFSVYSQNRFLPNWESRLQVGEGRDDLRNLSWSSRFETRQRQYQWLNNIDLGLGDLLLGFERTEQRVAGTIDYVETQRNVNAALAGYQARQGNHSLQLNLRHDNDSQFGGHNTGSAAYAYKFTPTWRFTLSGGTAFKAPTFNDLYYPYEDYGDWGSFVGNPDLRPEKSRSWESGVRYEWQGSGVSATYFQNRIEDLIAYDANPPSLDATMTNLNRAEIRGWSLKAHMRLGDWRAEASLDLQSPEDARTGNQLPRRAREHGSLQISRTIGDWDVRAEMIASGSRYDDLANTLKLDAYTLFNLGADYRLSKATLISLRLNNVFDEQYELARGYNTPDRNFFIGLNYQPR